MTLTELNDTFTHQAIHTGIHKNNDHTYSAHSPMHTHTYIDEKAYKINNSKYCKSNTPGNRKLVFSV